MLQYIQYMVDVLPCLLVCGLSLGSVFKTLSPDLSAHALTLVDLQQRWSNRL